LKPDIPIPVIPLFCEGFKSKIWATGFDMAWHALLTGIVKPPQKKTNVINFINFFGSEKRQITELFAKFGVEPLFLPAGTTVDQLSRMSESIATVSICGTLGTYLGNGLEKQYGVPYVQTLRPHGITGFEEWLRGIGKVIGKEHEVENYIALERARVLPELEKMKQQLHGIKAVVGMGPGYTFNFIRVLQELGVETIWASAWHFDPKYDKGLVVEDLDYLVKNLQMDIPFSVSDQQNFELMNVLNTLKPDIYFSRHQGTTVWALKQGTASVCVMDEYTAFGYNGTLNFASMILDAVTNRSLANNIAKRTKLPYTEWWLNQPNSTFLKKVEV
jgi:nitrogenase molybdenum-iron protein alpha chain